MEEKMINTNWHISVLIPARNEEELLPRCLNSILKAKAELPPYCTVDIILAVNASSDQTLTIGKSILGSKGEVLCLPIPNVGHARKMAAKTALERYKGALKHCWLANTDSDCEVPRNWLVHQLIRAHSGIQGMAGIVKVDSFGEHDIMVPAQFLNSYVIFSDGTHPHIHGANLGVRADAYERVGGWKELTTAEDHDLWNRMSSLKIPKISDANLFVYTSGRRKGRAPHGFAGTLAAFNKDINQTDAF